jgi:UBX domain-containing protein 1
VVTKTITFFRNGFVVDDGNLRRFDDPEQAAFLADIHAGLVPRELEEPDLGELNVNLVDRSFEDYRPASMSSSPPSRKPFQGDGYRLGEAPTALAASTSSKTQSIPANGSDGAVQPDDLDPNAPITQVQVRLADGTRLVTRMNISHRIADLRRLICAHRSDYAEQAFVFQTVLPRRPLEEESMTLADANLLNAVVMQQLLPQ